LTVSGAASSPLAMAVGTPMIGFHVLQGIGLPLRMNGVGTP
jgi:hypothetical protein